MSLWDVVLCLCFLWMELATDGVSRGSWVRHTCVSALFEAVLDPKMQLELDLRFGVGR